jgi:hypothetical protein
MNSGGTNFIPWLIEDSQNGRPSAATRQKLLVTQFSQIAAFTGGTDFGCVIVSAWHWL